MPFLLSEGTTRCALDATTAEVFTQKRFADLVADAHATGRDYYIGRVRCEASSKSGSKNTLSSGLSSLSGSNKSNSTSLTKFTNKMNQKGDALYFCYDARQLCKYVFEMVIGPKGRKIQIKNFTDPIYKEKITELSFFRLCSESETPLKAEYVGSYTDFLESNLFRTKIFFGEDPLDALSVSFKLSKREKVRVLSKSRMVSIVVFTVIVLLIVSCLVYLVEKGYFGEKKFGLDGYMLKKNENNINLRNERN